MEKIAQGPDKCGFKRQAVSQRRDNCIPILPIFHGAMDRGTLAFWLVIWKV